MKTNITYPKCNCLAGRYLSRLILGEKLEHREADAVAGSYRLAGFIHYLEQKHAWTISRTEIQMDSLDPTGRTASYTQYWLPTWMIEWAGTEGIEYANHVLGLEAEKVAQRVAATTPHAGASSKWTNEQQHSNKQGTEERINGPQ